ncbi:MAG TPA: glycoside hydrolase family 3 C-terminal domain-containing protein [Steroidobacteraceae bacterium]
MAQRVDDLIARMTLEEKASQLVHTAAAIPRLGVPSYNWWNEGLHGVARAGIATVFPQAIGMAATFDEPLIHDVADVISTEFRAKYRAQRHADGSSDWYKGLTVWSPNINIFRDPRWGRGQETYGEDPYLTSRLGVAFVTGLQGDDPVYLKTVATPKHFDVHSGPEPTRHTVDVTASRHDMEDTYLPAFRAAIMQGKAQSVMCAYNAINGEPACANTVLLQEHLRHDWQFGGYVVSDCGAMGDIFSNHHYAASLAQAAADAFKAGTDLICRWPPSGPDDDGPAIASAVQQGLLSEQDLDQALRRLFLARFRLGLFDPPSKVPYAHITAADNDTPAHTALALRTARESIVLLRNRDHFLPLRKHYRTIAVIGPDADSLDALEGNYNGSPSKPVTVLEGIRRRFAHSRVVYVQGTGLIGPVLTPIPAAALFTDATRKTPGLRAQYFANVDLRGAPVMMRVDRNVNFSWGFGGVSPRLSQNYSVRWSGVLVPSRTRDYLIGFTGQDGYRLWLDDQLVVADWTNHRPATTQTRMIHLEKSHSYRIRIEYYQTLRGAEARLVWSEPGVQEQAAADAARRADLIIMVMGLSARIEGEEMNVSAEGFLGGDRTSIALPAPQLALMQRIQALGKPTVLVLSSGSALGISWADEHLPAVLEAWYPGEQGGTAVAQALAGDFSPAGRLPVTFYKSVGQLPPFEDYSMAHRTYRYFEGEPLYPFGFGLSYTSFRYDHAAVDHPEVPPDGAVTVSIDVTNTGTVDSDEVVQLYLTHRGVAGAPQRALQGFQRVHLAPAQKRTLSFVLRDRALSIVDEAGVRRIVPGGVDVWVGGGQPESRHGLPESAGARTEFTITGAATLPD